MSKTILITGGAGFIGSNFIPYFCNKYPEYFILNLDKLTYAGNLDNLKECEDLSNYKFIKGDVCDKELVKNLFEDYDIRGVIHFAAESHVDNSINNPEIFIKTNVEGTLNLLNNAYQYWMIGPNNPKQGYEDCRFHYISTDEVYGALGDTGSFSEDTPYAPTNPYSVSKASADFMVQAYHKTYGLNTTKSNCSNNYGPKQHQEKLIPHVINQALNEQSITIYGTGKNIRDWLYVLDHCKAIDLIYHESKSGETYNIGCNNEIDNVTIVKIICNLLDQKKPRKEGKYEDLITFIKDRVGHDFRYAINSSKLQKELEWKPESNFNDSISKTIDWYMNKDK